MQGVYYYAKPCWDIKFYSLILQPESDTAPERDGESGQGKPRNAQTAREGGADVQGIRLD